MYFLAALGPKHTLPGRGGLFYFDEKRTKNRDQERESTGSVFYKQNCGKLRRVFIHSFIHSFIQSGNVFFYAGAYSISYFYFYHSRGDEYANLLPGEGGRSGL
jgi:hypothetical protein